jgi:hypothetical protein
MGSGPEVERGSEPEPVRRPGFFARLFGRYRGRPEALVEPEAPVAPVAPVVPAEALEPEPEVIAIAAAPEPVAVEPEPGAPEPEASDAGGPDPEAVLVAALDSLGQAHHRPYSRA